MSSYYNPRGYVPGGSSVAKARAIQALARRKPVVRKPVARPTFAGAKPVSDPFLSRANTLAASMFKPLFTELGNARGLAEQNARNAYGLHASNLESSLRTSGAAIPQAFDTAIGQSAKINEAIANRLSGQGQAASGGLAAALAQIQADPAGATALASQYQGAGNAGFVKDSADLQNLVAQRAQAASYQGKLPGIARLTANRDLENALSEQRGYFGEQEAGLRAGAADRAYDLYGQFREEDVVRKRDLAEQRQAALDRAAEEKMSLRALREAAVTQAEKNRYSAMEKELDRQLKRDLAQLDADVRVATNNPPKKSAVTGPANQQWISVNGKKVKNPNYVPPKNSPSSPNDSWLTPGSAKRDRAIQAGARAVIGTDGASFNPIVLRRLKQFPGSPDAIINTAINQALRAQGIPVNHASAKAIRKAIRQRLSGKKWIANDGATYEFVA